MDQEKRETGEELDLEVPNHAVKTLKRMWDSSKAQHVRLYLVGASIYQIFLWIRKWREKKENDIEEK